MMMLPERTITPPEPEPEPWQCGLCGTEMPGEQEPYRIDLPCFDGKAYCSEDCALEALLDELWCNPGPIRYLIVAP